MSLSHSAKALESSVKLTLVAAPGEFQIMVGPNSKDLKNVSLNVQ